MPPSCQGFRSVKMAGVASVEELDTRSMQPQTCHRPQHFTVSSPEQIMILRGPRARRRQFSARARIAMQCGVRVGIDTVSMLDDRLFNGDSRRKSQSSIQVCLLASNRRLRTENHVKTFSDDTDIPRILQRVGRFASLLDGDTEELLVRVPI